MITKEQENKHSKLSSTVKTRTLVALNKRTAETGNRSFLVNRALELYLGLDEETDQQETEKIAS